MKLLGKSRAFWTLSGLLLSRFSPAAPQEQPRFQVEAQASLFEVRVLDKEGKPVRSLGAEDFQVREEGRSRPIIFFQERDHTPISLAVLLDQGPNMNEEDLLQAKRFLFELIHLLQPQDEILLALYDQDFHLLSPLSRDRYQLAEAVFNISPGGRAGFWKRFSNLFVSTSNTGYAVDMALLELKKARHPTRLVLVISAGFANMGPATVEHLRVGGARFFGIRMDNRLGDIFSLGGDQAARERAEKATGGFTFTARNLVQKASLIAEVFKHSYQIAFLPEEKGKLSAPDRVEFQLPGQPSLRLSWARVVSPGEPFSHE